MRLVSIVLAVLAIAIDAFALSLLTNVSLPALMFIGMLSFALSIAFEVINRAPINARLKFSVSMIVLAIAAVMFLIRELSEALLIFTLATLALTWAFILATDMEIKERFVAYLALSAVIATFPISYALLAVYITYRASVENLLDTGKLAPIKKFFTYVSGAVLLPVNVFIIVAELFGVYKPSRNLYLIVLTILITVLLAVKRLLKERSKGKLGRLISVSLPALIGVYAGGYAMFKINPEAAPIDGIAKALAALAAIIERPSSTERENFY